MNLFGFVIFDRFKNKYMPNRLITFLVPVLFIVFCFKMVDNQKAVDRKVHYFQYDQAGYYSYLPAVFIYNQDWTFSFFDSNGMRSAQFLKEVNGVSFNKYPVGVSVLQIPFFLGGHLVAGLNGDAQNGFTKPYRRAVFLSVLFYVTLGLLILRNVLSRYFSNWTVFFSLGVIALGTNLIFYTTHEPLMSHAYSFFIFSCLIMLSDQYYRTQRGRYLLLMGVCAGFVLLTRIPNAIVFIIPVLWGIESRANLKARFLSFWSNRLFIFGAIGLTFLVFLPQLLYYKAVLGSFWIDSYGNERFFFGDPLIGKLFFSFRKGLLIYTPLVGFAFLGLFFLKRFFKAGFLAVTTYVIIQLYIVSSWGCWWYGGGFSMRPFVESLALLIFPLAALIEWSRLRYWSKFVFVGLLIPFFWLQELHLHQYCKSIIHNDSMSKESYKVIFGKRDPIGQEAMDRREEYLLRPDPGRVNRDAVFRKEMK